MSDTLFRSRRAKGTPFRRRATVAALVALAAGPLLAACGSGSTAGSSATSDTLTVALALAPQSLNPGKDGNGGQNIVQWLAYEPLIRANSDGTYSPGLATKWSYVGTDNQAFEMTIRTDAKFADGTPVTAQAVADTINYYIANPGPLSHFMYGITKATVKDDQTVAIALNKPNPILPQVFSQVANWGDVISPAGLKNPDALTTSTFGAGPYTLDTAQTVAGDHYTFERNKLYWNNAATHYDKVVVKVIPDANSALQALRSGQIQADMNSIGNIVDQAKTTSGVDVATGPGAAQALFLMDRAGQTTPALGKTEVRQALNYAVDRSAIAKAIGGGLTPTDQVAPQGTDGYDSALADAYSYDPAKAKQLLAQAGYPHGFSFTALSISPYDTDTIAQAIADQLGKIGVKMTIKSDGADLNKLIADMATKKYPAVMFNAGGGMFTNALQNFASPVSPLNPFASQGQEVTGAFDALAAAPSDSSKDAAVALNKAVTENAWFVPVAETKTYVFTSGLAGVGSVGDGGVLDVLSWKPAS